MQFYKHEWVHVCASHLVKLVGGTCIYDMHMQNHISYTHNAIEMHVACEGAGLAAMFTLYMY